MIMIWCFLSPIKALCNVHALGSNGDDKFTCKWLACNREFEAINEMAGHIIDAHVSVSTKNACFWVECEVSKN